MQLCLCTSLAMQLRAAARMKKTINGFWLSDKGLAPRHIPPHSSIKDLSPRKIDASLKGK